MLTVIRASLQQGYPSSFGKEKVKVDVVGYKVLSQGRFQTGEFLKLWSSVAQLGMGKRNNVSNSCRDSSMWSEVQALRLNQDGGGITLLESQSIICCQATEVEVSRWKSTILVVFSKMKFGWKLSVQKERACFSTRLLFANNIMLMLYNSNINL